MINLLVTSAHHVLSQMRVVKRQKCAAHSVLIMSRRLNVATNNRVAIFNYRCYFNYMKRVVQELGEDFRLAPSGSSYDYDWKGGRVLELKFHIQAVRDLYAATVQLARVLAEKPELRQACLAVRIPRISRDRLRQEWDSVKSVLRPAIASKLALISVGGDQPWADPAEPELEKLAATLYANSAGTGRQTSTPRQAITPKFFEIFKIIVNHWLRKQGPIRIAEIIVQSGSSYPTVAEAVNHLVDTQELIRQTNRRVEMPAFPRRTWGEVLALSSSLRMPIYFADTSGRPSDPQALLRRIGAKAPAELAVGGVVAARHWDPDFDLHGVPRLDLSVHAPHRTYDTGAIQRADPALTVVGSRSANIVLALHPLLRKEPLFEPSTKIPLPVVDPVETLLDLHELGLSTQAEELVGRMIERAAH